MCECASTGSGAPPNPSFCNLAVKSIDLCLWSMKKMDLWRNLKQHLN